MASQLRSVDTLLTTAVHTSVDALHTGPEDVAVVRLALLYAAAIDSNDEQAAYAALNDMGPKLLSALDALGATPKSRGARKPPASRAQSRLEALRAARTG